MTATTQRGFDSLRKRAGKPRGTCIRCGGASNAGAVRVELQEISPENRAARKCVATKAVSFCEPCCVEVYTDVLDALGVKP